MADELVKSLNNHTITNDKNDVFLLLFTMLPQI